MANRRHRTTGLLFIFFLTFFPVLASAGWRSEVIDDRAISDPVFVISPGGIVTETSTGYPHIFYSGSENHAYFDGSQWQRESIPYDMRAATVDSNNKLHVIYSYSICYTQATVGRGCEEWESFLNYATNVSGTWESFNIASYYNWGTPWLSIPYVFEGISIVLDANEKVHVSYAQEMGPSYLSYATNASGSWVVSAVEAAGSGSINNSLALSSDGKAHISYYYNYYYGINELKYATNASGSWASSTIDSAGDVGKYNAIALDSNNRVHISYVDTDNNFLKYATDVSGTWDTTAVDYESGDSVNGGTDIAVDSNDHVHISYYDSTNSNVKHATDATSSWIASDVASGSGGSSIALDSNDVIHMSYQYGSSPNTEIRYASNKTGSWDSSIIDLSHNFSVGNGSLSLDADNNIHVGYYTSDGLTLATNELGEWNHTSAIGGISWISYGVPLIATDSANIRHVCYNEGGSVKYTTNSSGSWTGSVIGMGVCGSIAADSNGKAHISYYDSTNEDLKYSTNASGSWITSTLDSAGDVGQYNSLTVDSNDNVHISYYDGTNYNLKYASNASGAWTTSVIDSIGDVGKRTSIALDSNDGIHISYLDDTNDDLKYATNSSGAWVDAVVAADAYMFYTSIAAGPSDAIHILYRSTSNGTRHTTNATGSWVFSDFGFEAGFTYSNRSLAVDASGYIHIISGITYITDAPPHPLTGTSVAAGHEHTLLIKPDGTLWAWGHNDQGQLGVGTTVDKLNPVQIGNETDWAEVSAGWKHSIALKKDGTLWAWGDNDYGQLGDATTTDSHSPVQVGTGSNWAAISAGGAHNLALTKYGTLWAWGLNSQGQLGDGTSTGRLFPVLIGNDTNWDAISAGWEHSAAIKRDKSLYTWGWNDQGQLGDGTAINRHSPVQIGTNEWVQVSAGWQHTVALKDSDTLWGWGDNDFGQLGDGATTDRHSPVQIAGITNISLVEAGGAHTLVRTYYGELYAWGLNSVGQLGDGTTTTRLSPIQVNTENDWGLIAAGWEHSISMKENGSFWIWGWNEYGQLGDGTTTDRYFPGPADFMPTADFTGAPTKGCDFMQVQFTDASTGGDGALSYYWEFIGNGDAYATPTTSTVQNPVANFEHYGGTYPHGYATVRLTVTDADGDSDVIEKVDYIYVGSSDASFPYTPCSVITAGFTASPNSGDAPLTVSFTNSSTALEPPLTYEWDFDNDGTVDSTEENPSHTYTSVGNYTPALTATDIHGRTNTTNRSVLVKIGSVPAADFTGTPTSGSNPLTVSFTNASTDGDAPFNYEWDFDNDGTVDSTEENPTYTYTSSGYFTVKLTVTDVHGDTDTEIKQDYIFLTTNSIPAADFTGAPTKGCDLLQVQFTDSTTGGDGQLSYFWEFIGDGNAYPRESSTSTEQNPLVYFDHYGGTYPHGFITVRLTVTDADGDSDFIEKVDYIYVGSSDASFPYTPCSVITAGFTASPNSGDAPLTVSFTNSSTALEPPLTYEWDFDNDGTVDSTEENPSYTYTSVGNYTPALTATDIHGRTNTTNRSVLVKIGSVPAADFTGTPTSGSNPLTVSFTNASTDGDAPFNYEWDFDNDGTVDSTEENPTYTYTSSGYFTVKLTVTDVHGDTDTEIKQDYIFLTTNSIPAADFTGAPTKGCDLLQVQFTDSTTGGDGQLSYFWEFIGDGNAYPRESSTSTEQNPLVYFDHYGGTYPHGFITVRLTVTDADGDSDFIEKVDYIYVGSSDASFPYTPCSVITAGFTASPNSGDAPLTVSFANSSTALEPPLTYEWDFDNDGTVDSTEENPSYTYNAVGTYTVKLTATDQYGRSSSLTKADYITTCGLVRIQNPLVYYETLLDAYNAAWEDDVIQTRAGLTETLNLDIEKSITLEGGYNCDYSEITGSTTINGNLTISGGTVTIENIILE